MVQPFSGPCLDLLHRNNCHLFLTSLCIFWRCSLCGFQECWDQNKGVNISTSLMWGSSVFSKASSFCFLTEEAALVSLHGELEHRAGWHRRRDRYSSSPLQHGEKVQGRDGGRRMTPCHSFLFTQHKIAALQREEERLTLFTPHVPATLRPTASVSVRHKQNIIFLVLLHLCESEQKAIPEKSQGMLVSSSLLPTPLISIYI